MNARIETFWVQKLGARADQYEDASFPADGALPLDGLRLVLADGATESFLSRLWAQHLVYAFGESPHQGVKPIWEAARTAWQAVVRNYLKQRDEEGRPLQWYEEPGLSRGGYATLLMVEFKATGPDRGRLWAWGVGDCCLFQVRDHRALTLFPFTSPEQFNATPELVFSTHTSQALARKRRDDHRGFRAGDVLYLMTDALAAWTLERLRQGEPPWPVLSRFSPSRPGRFRDWVETQKRRGCLRDDDVTLMRVALERSGGDG